jgi:hypothetical protein
MLNMKDQIITALAEYFTSSEVASQSIALQMPPGGLMRLQERAERFFELRKTLGIHGYADSAEAEAALRERLK